MNAQIPESDLDLIRSRIARAEEGTTGEIVQYIVDQSDDYEVVSWRGSALAAALFLSLTLLVYLFYDGWSLGWLYSGIGLAAGVVISFLVGALLVHYVPPVFRLIAGTSLLARRVRSRAERSFIEEGIFQTRQRTGILLFISLREHRIEVLPDIGISAVIPADAWNRVVDAARTELRKGDLTEALIAAVEACGAILRHHGSETVEDDTNELDDSLRIGGR